MLNERHMGGMVGDEIVSLPSCFSQLAAHHRAFAAFDFISAFSALPTPMETDMSNDINIPPEAVKAAARAIGEETYVGNKQTLRDAATAAIRAALAAWPGVKLENLCGWVMDGPDLPYVEEVASIILPLTENPDAEA